MSLFKNPRFTAASGSITIGFFVLAGFTFLMTQYFQFIKGYSPFGTGLRLLPVATAIAIAAVVGTRLAVRVGNNVVVGAGLALWGGAILWIATVNTSTPYYVIVGQMIMGGGGLGLITAPATEAIMGAVPTEKAGVGSAVNDATRLFGAALGVAVIGSIAASLYHSRLASTVSASLPAPASAAAKGSVGGALVAAKTLGARGLAGPAQSLVSSAVGAFEHSLNGALHVAGVIALLGAVMAALLLPARPRTAEDAAPSEVEMWLSGARRLRSIPSPAAPVIGAAGGSVSVLQLDGDWAHVRGGDVDGWVSRHFLHDLPPATVDA
ncbi:MAG: MFS transporter [Acidimicrobiia bacterium]|nr:MFS transporter [Acidimicrobiia bacterium]